MAPVLLRDELKDDAGKLAEDDDEVSRYVIRQDLMENNVRVLEAPSGSLGLERVDQEQIDLVLLDLDLPDMTGYEVLARLHKEGNTPPIVIVSGMLLSAADRQRLSAAAAIVPKSEISQGVLRDVVANLTREGNGARP